MSATDHLPIEQLSAHLDGETTAEERARVALHLEGCSACREALDDLGRVAQATAALGVPALPEGLHARIRATVDATRRRARRRAWFGAAASLVAAGSVATAWYLQQQPPPVFERALSEPGEAEAPAKRNVARSAPAPSVAAESKEKLEARDELSAPAPAPAPPPASPRAAVVESDAKREEMRDPAVGGAEGGVAGGVPGGSFRQDEIGVRSQMSKVSAPASSAIDDGPCAAVEFLEVAPDGELDRRSLLAALENIGVSPQPGSDERTIDLVLPRARWTECRVVLERAGIRVEDDRIRALPGDCLGIRVRTAAP